MFCILFLLSASNNTYMLTVSARCLQTLQYAIVRMVTLLKQQSSVISELHIGDLTLL